MPPVRNIGRVISKVGRFTNGVNKVLEMGRTILIEVGGGGSLAGLVREHPAYRPKIIAC